MTLIFNVIMTIIILFVIPVLVGNTACGILKNDISLPESYAVGYMTIWTVFQLVAVPMVLLKQSFTVCFYVIATIVLLLALAGIYKKYFIRLDIKSIEKSDGIMYILCGFGVLALVVTSLVLSHLDEDDSRFVVNSVDMLNTNRMFLTNPATGEGLDTWAGELAKDVTSPWAVYIAAVAKTVGVKAVVAAHLVIPVGLIVLLAAAFWLISKELVGEDVKSRTLFLYVATFLALYSGYSSRSAYDYFLIRSWQGKAVVAGIGIPLLLLFAMRIYKDDKSAYAKLFITGIAMCLMSGMGIIISTIGIGAFGLVYGIEKKSIVKMITVGALAAPSMVFFLINQMQ